jgi:hypothetical protein
MAMHWGEDSIWNWY